ncbi:MAG: polysaccharide deacetylase family protein [Anaerovoracaceae bacterium]
MKKTDYLLLAFLVLLMGAGILSYAVSCSGISSCLGITVSQTPLSLSDSRETVDIPILMYHSISKSASDENEYTISQARFENDLKWLRDNGYTTIFPSQLVSFVQEGTMLPAKPVIISFDDGFANNYLYAFPLLEKYNMKAVIALIGVESDRSSGDIYRNQDYGNMTWGEVAILSRSGLIEFASHTYDLHSISGGRKGADKKSGESSVSYRQILTSDLTKNQDLLETASGSFPITFAWPYGAYPADRSADPILRDIGFLVTFTSYQHTSTVNQGQPESLYGLGRYLRTPSFDIKKII